MNNNLLVFGSVARGDSNKNSDIDLLTIGNDTHHKIILNNLNISYYNESKFENMSKNGSLFLYHLNKESKIIYDEGGILKRIIYEDFVLKENYNNEISFAYTFLKEIFLIYNNTMNFSFANSKIVWCLRTIYSGLGANDQIPLFSKKSISLKFGKITNDFLKIKTQSSNQSKYFSKILDHLNEVINIPLVVNLSQDAEKVKFSENSLKIILNSKSNFEFDY